jgi:hypothetical protein
MTWSNDQTQPGVIIRKKEISFGDFLLFSGMGACSKKGTLFFERGALAERRVILNVPGYAEDIGTNTQREESPTILLVGKRDEIELIEPS